MKVLAYFAAALSVHGAVDVLATMKRDCYGCHGDGQVLSKLDLRSREAMLKGGARGPAIVPGNADASLLVAAVEGRNGMQMPPGAKPSAEFAAALREWINGGAVWGTPKEDKWGSYKPEDLWAFRQPKPRDASKAVDSFLGASKAKADKRTLIRRVTIDLTGLPPTPKEIDEFVKDNARDAWSRLIDRLLASPQYGERWARHWLDVVRYADTNGYSNDFERPNAWRYRDYVIRAFNQDKPYNQFILEQIAGDELFPGNAEALIATGFLRAGPWEHTGMSVEAVTRQMFLDDVTHATAATFLGLTLGCAKCHDHKFDPLPTKDYYRMQAVFATTEFARPKLPFLASENQSDLAAGKTHLQTIADGVKAKIEELGGTKKKLPPDQFEEIKLYQKHDALHRQSLDRYEPKAFAVSSGPRNGETDGGPNLRYPNRAEYKATDVHVLPGGNIQAPAEKVSPGMLSLLDRFGGYPSPAVPEIIDGRRAVLAKWIANEKNPLTARVMANRIWQYHFGKGLAADANNFGKMGAKPSNAELLDWLAGELVESGWSVKAVHRAILNSAAYQSARSEGRRIEAEVLRDSILYVSGELSPERGGPGVFPEINEDVARQPLHRMGSLSPVYRPDALKRMRNRRTIYTFQQRSLVDPLVEVFNGAGMDLSCDRRDTATVPTQAFTLFNSQFAHDMSLALGARVDQERRDSRGKISELFLRILGRAPSAAELSSALLTFNKLLAQHKAASPTPRAAAKPVVHKITSELTGEQHQFTHPEDPASYEYNLHPSEATPVARALGDIALALINSNEFVYVY